MPPIDVVLIWWEHVSKGDYEIHFVPTQHFSGRGFCFNRTPWGGFVIRSGGYSIWFADDTGYYKGLERINERLGPFSLAFLPIGHDEPNDDLKEKHLSPFEAARLHKDLQIQKTVAIHFDTYRMSLDDCHDHIEDYQSTLIHENLSRSEFLLPLFGRMQSLSLVEPGTVQGTAVCK